MMKKILRYGYVVIITCIILLMSPSVILAQEEILRITLKDVIDMALEASKNLKLQENDVKRKSSERKKEKSCLFPKIMGDIGWSNNFQYPDIAATATMRDYHLNAGVTVSQTIFTFGRISNVISAAQKALEASRLNKEGTRQEVICNAKIAFYNTYLAKRTLDIAEESYNNALKNKQILEDRFSGGRLSKYENIKISADIASRKPTVNNARADFASAMETLKVIIGIETKSSVKLIENFTKNYPTFDREILAVSLCNNQPTIKALAKNIEEKEAIIKSKKSMLLPEVSAFATWNHKGDSHDYYVGSDNMDDYGVAGLKVNVPIWVGGISREMLYQAKIDKEDAKLKYKKVQEEYLLLLDKAINEYQEYRKTLEANKEAIRLVEEAFKYSQELFSSGQVSVTDLNDAELQLTNVKINKEITVFILNSRLAIIEKLTLMERTHE